MTVPVRPFTGGPAGVPGQNGQPQAQPHPTIGNLGLMPGGVQPQGVVQPQSQQPQSYVTQQLQQANPMQTLPQGMPPMQQQQQQPHPTVPTPQQPLQQSGPINYGQQPQQPNNYQPTAPVQPQNTPQFVGPQGQRFEIPDNVILDGASVPPELRGKTWGQARQIYTALAGSWLQSRQQPQVQPQPQAQLEPQVQPQAGRPQGPREGNGFWADPEGTIARVVEQRVQSAMAPMAQRSAQQAAEEAMKVAAAGIQDWANIQPEVIQVITESGARAEHLGDPRVWANAADLARGRLLGRGQYQAPNVVPAPQGQLVRGPGAYVPAQVAPQIGGFFTEAPTPPQQQYGQGVNTSLTPEEDYYRQQMGVSVEDFVAWRSMIKVQR